jgi:hypothetical protein
VEPIGPLRRTNAVAELARQCARPSGPQCRPVVALSPDEPCCLRGCRRTSNYPCRRGSVHHRKHKSSQHGTARPLSCAHGPSVGTRCPLGRNDTPPVCSSSSRRHAWRKQKAAEGAQCGRETQLCKRSSTGLQVKEGEIHMNCPKRILDRLNIFSIISFASCECRSHIPHSTIGCVNRSSS